MQSPLLVEFEGGVKPDRRPGEGPLLTVTGDRQGDGV
jgi:hypothetical protein